VGRDRASKPFVEPFWRELKISVPGYYDEKIFRPGDAFTIEPGIYINGRMLDILPDTPKNRAFIAAVQGAVRRYQNIGVRIEDDYVVTATGVECITPAPRTIAEVEAEIARRPHAAPVP